jgi:hypothetical protein
MTRTSQPAFEEQATTTVTALRTLQDVWDTSGVATPQRSTQDGESCSACSMNRGLPLAVAELGR